MEKNAVVITYDDAIDQHLDHAIPVLDSLGLKATFYVTAFSQSMQARLHDWKKLATKGHELGNHTLYHPCIGGKGREWVKPACETLYILKDRLHYLKPVYYDKRNYRCTCFVVVNLVFTMYIIKAVKETVLRYKC